MQEKIIFYDGDCGFCNNSVKFILKNRKNNSLKFIPLQAKEAKIILAKKGIDVDMSTIYYLSKNKINSKSTAILKLIKELKFYWVFLSLAWIIPTPWRDFIYNFIAKRRNKIAGKHCYIPTLEERKMFPYLN